MVTVEKLYEACDAIDRSKDPGIECEKECLLILKGSKGQTNEKKLASQLIVRYFHKFPNLQSQALDAMFELCEDDDINIRKLVIKELPTICKVDGPHVLKIADVLVQLLQSEDVQENQIVQASLMMLLNQYTKGVLQTLFGHILNAEEDLMRERAARFLVAKLRQLSPDVISREIEDYIVEQSKVVLQDCTGDEFVLFMNLLAQLSHLQTVAGRQHLLSIVTDQADLEKTFDPTDSDRVDQVIQCVKQAVPFCSKNVQSTSFVNYMLNHCVPVLDTIKVDADVPIEPSVELLQALADLAPHCGDLENPSKQIEPLFDRLMSILPIPPSEDAAAISAIQDEDTPNLRFSELEAVFWAFHQLSKKHMDLLTRADRAEVMKEFRKRLQYLARVIQVYSQKLREVLKKLPKEQLKTEESRIKVLALRTTSNIMTLLKDLLHSPPLFKATISPSWKPSEQKPQQVIGKRTMSVDNGPPAKKDKDGKHSAGQAIYQPPGGKYSEKAGNFPTDQSGQQRGRGRGFFRGRGRGRGWNRGRSRFY